MSSLFQVLNTNNLNEDNGHAMNQLKFFFYKFNKTEKYLEWQWCMQSAEFFVSLPRTKHQNEKRKKNTGDKVKGEKCKK